MVPLQWTPLETLYQNSQTILLHWKRWPPEQNRKTNKKGKRKVQGVPQSQTAALPRPQEEEETDKSKQAQTEKTYEKH